MKHIEGEWVAEPLNEVKRMIYGHSYPLAVIQEQISSREQGKGRSN